MVLCVLVLFNLKVFKCGLFPFQPPPSPNGFLGALSLVSDEDDDADDDDDDDVGDDDDDADDNDG